MYCNKKGCNETIHVYNKIIHLYCFEHGQEEVNRYCSTCKQYKKFKRMNISCYSCLQKNESRSILTFLRHSSQFHF